MTGVVHLKLKCQIFTSYPYADVSGGIIFLVHVTVLKFLQQARKRLIWMPFVWGEFSLYKQQSSDRWQCLNCAPRATRNNNFTPFTCFWTADGGATVLRSGCYLVVFSLVLGFFAQ